MTRKRLHPIPDPILSYATPFAILYDRDVTEIQGKRPAPIPRISNEAILDVLWERKTMSNVAELTTDTFDASVKEGVSLLDFWAEWCGPCKMIAPMIGELAAEYDGKARFAKINIDDHGELAERFNVSSIPTLLIMKDGEEVKRFIGVTAKAELAKALDTATA